MYKCDKPDTEEYLLGRRIDKHVDDPKEDDEANKGNFSFVFTPILLLFITLILAYFNRGPDRFLIHPAWRTSRPVLSCEWYWPTHGQGWSAWRNLVDVC